MSELSPPSGSRGYGIYGDAGAGDGNRTHATSLEGWDSTIELHPHGWCSSHISFCILPHFFPAVNGFLQIFHVKAGLSLQALQAVRTGSSESKSPNSGRPNSFRPCVCTVSSFSC